MADLLTHSRVLKVPGCPSGFCPLHILEGLWCDRSCIETRIEFANLAGELDEYWKTLWFRRRSSHSEQTGTAA